MKNEFSVFSGFTRKKNDGKAEKVLIPTYSMHPEITTASYEGGKIMDRLMENEAFDNECIKFIKHADKMDANNGSYKDQRVKTVVRDAIAELEKERAEHEYTIRLPLSQMHTGDMIYHKERLKQKEEELEILKKKRDIYKAILHKDTIFETVEGR